MGHMVATPKHTDSGTDITVPCRHLLGCESISGAVTVRRTDGSGDILMTVPDGGVRWAEWPIVVDPAEQVYVDVVDTTGEAIVYIST